MFFVFINVYVTLGFEYGLSATLYGADLCVHFNVLLTLPILVIGAITAGELLMLWPELAFLPSAAEHLASLPQLPDLQFPRDL